MQIYVYILLSLTNVIVEKCIKYAHNFHQTLQIGVVTILHGETWKRLPITNLGELNYIEVKNVRNNNNKICRFIKEYKYAPV